MEARTAKESVSSRHTWNQEVQVAPEFDVSAPESGAKAKFGQYTAAQAVEPERTIAIGGKLDVTRCCSGASMYSCGARFRLVRNLHTTAATEAKGVNTLSFDGSHDPILLKGAVQSGDNAPVCIFINAIMYVWRLPKRWEQHVLKVFQVAASLDLGRENSELRRVLVAWQ